jgi:hypothetical protein
MKNKLRNLLLVSCLTALAACNGEGPGPAVSVGDPERLLDVSSEVVTLSLSTNDSVSKLTETLNSDAPARAELSCAFKDTRCTQAKALLNRRGIPLTMVDGKGDSVSLYYERVVARDCDQRYYDNTRNNRSENHEAFGCATVANMVQMVSDKKQFTNPALMELPDAEKAVQGYRAYLKPPKPAAETSGTSSTTGAPPK